MRFVPLLCLAAALSAPTSLLFPVSAVAQDTPPAPPSASPAATPAVETQDVPAPPAPQTTPDQQPAPAPNQTAAPAPDQTPLPHPGVNFRPFAPLDALDNFSSSYIPLDSWIYPAVMRLYSLGYVDSAFLDMRPWTRLSLAHMLAESGDKVGDRQDPEAIRIYTALQNEIEPDATAPLDKKYGTHTLESVYTRVLGISGLSLRDSFHLGQTDINDFGRPYTPGFNNQTGFSARSHYGRFSVYFRGEYQHAPSAAGYLLPLAQYLARTDALDGVPTPVYGNPTIPTGPLASVNNLTVLEGYASAHLAGHEISFGKMDNWYGPAVGGGMGWSNNAENVYSFRINRVEPLYIPFISKLVGPLRYDFFVGPLKGHTAPVSPWVHAEKFAFKPTRNVEIGFERTVIWGGIGHEPVNLDSFFRSFFSLNDTAPGVKFSRKDPGARFSAFDFTWRLPYVRDWLTLYLDSEVHDDVTPPSAPRRSAIRPGIYLTRFPRLHQLDLRVEGVSTDPPTGRSVYGSFMYIEVVQKNGYTNNGQMFGDWIGREAKGGQAWLTWHLSPREWVQLSYRNQKTAKDFISGGTTLNDFDISAVKRLTPQVELNAYFQYERWRIPIYQPGLRTDTSTSVQLTWYPKLSQKY